MKQNVLDILIFLFEHYLNADEQPLPNSELLKVELTRAGFAPLHVNRALEWLDSLALGAANGGSAITAGAASAVRVFSDPEQQRLDTDCRGYLLHLENIGILPGAQRELVIDRLMALEADDLELGHVKWVVLMVLFSQPGQEQAYARMEDLVFEQQAAALH
jgi:Smg protein